MQVKFFSTIVDRSETGPYSKESDFDLGLAKLVMELVKKYAQKARIKKNVHPHTFRHTCATTMLKNNADLNSIRKILGHTSLNTTQIYTHLNITDLKEVHRRCHPRERDKE